MADEPAAPRARLALLIDADNIRSDFLPVIFRETSALGTVTIKRVYGHFASSTMNAWQPLLHRHALTPVHIPPAVTGKNATDMKLAIEAMDLLHRGQLEGFCIASSDSDFTTLASRIREDGVAVYGFGEQKASEAFVSSCDRFFYCDILLQEERKAGAPAAPTKARIPLDDIYAAIEDASGRGRMVKSRIGGADPHQTQARLRSTQLRLQEAQRSDRAGEGGRGEATPGRRSAPRACGPQVGLYRFIPDA